MIKILLVHYCALELESDFGLGVGDQDFFRAVVTVPQIPARNRN